MGQLGGLSRRQTGSSTTTREDNENMTEQMTTEA